MAQTCLCQKLKFDLSWHKSFQTQKTSGNCLFQLMQMWAQTFCRLIIICGVENECKEPQIRAKDTGTKLFVRSVYWGFKDISKFWVLFKDPETQPHP